jgi:hypothetical protein
LKAWSPPLTSHLRGREGFLMRSSKMEGEKCV